MIIDLQHIARGDADLGPGAVIRVVRIRHDHVEAVIAPGHLEDDEDGAVLPGRHLQGGIRRGRVEGKKGLFDESGQRPGHGSAEDPGAEELPAGA